ncbi:hypothetical protein DAETH_37310 (plasmid) [Deinococcus aetherius]|uniref:Uncharacterized protein n=1 Tax=Deinococcus aetherius TaxID=200252 RepID=A0ABN6RQ47_9DEIO|nr:hypothetical protein DAETH_37310 [Deinococcus aetherius]
MGARDSRVERTDTPRVTVIAVHPQDLSRVYEDVGTVVRNLPDGPMQEGVMVGDWLLVARTTQAPFARRHRNPVTVPPGGGRVPPLPRTAPDLTCRPQPLPVAPAIRPDLQGPPASGVLESVPAGRSQAEPRRTEQGA